MATNDLVVARHGWTEGCIASWDIPRLTGTVSLPSGEGTMSISVIKSDPTPIVTKVTLTSDDNKGNVTTLTERAYAQGVHYNYSDLDKTFEFEIPYGTTRKISLSIDVTFATVIGKLDGQEVEWEGTYSTTVTDSVTFSQVDDSETWGSESSKRLNIPYVDIR